VYTPAKLFTFHILRSKEEKREAEEEIFMFEFRSVFAFNYLPLKVTWKF